MKSKRIYAWLLLLLLLGAIMFLVRPRGSAAVPLLFAELPVAEVPSYFPEQTIAKRHRWVRLNQLGTPHLFLNTGKENRVVLNLFPDLEVEATVVANRNEGQTVYGLIEDNPDSLMVMSFHEDIMMGVAVLPDARQVLISHVIDDKYVIVEVDPGKGGNCGNCVGLGKRTSGAGSQEHRRISPAKGTETSAVPHQSSWSRRIAMGDSGTLKETTVECRECQKDAPIARFRPLLAALGVPPGLLAGAANTGKWGFGSMGGNRHQNVGPTSSSTVKFQPSGDMEYVDVLFIYENGLVAQELGNAQANNPLATNATAMMNMEAKVERMIDLTNGIFIASGVPVELRIAEVPLPGGPAQKLFAGWFRAPNADPTNGASLQDANLAGSGYNGPAWEEVQAPVRPNTTANDANTWTVWNPIGGQVQAIAGIYQPRYMDLSDFGNPSMQDYFNWIFDAPNNSLLFGDQYWGANTFQAPIAGNSLEPYINHPEGYQWFLEPVDQRITATMYTPTENLGLRTGPVDHPESIYQINADPATFNFSHQTAVMRYDQGGVADTYGTDYNGTYTGVLGLRMDLNNTDWNGTVSTGDPMDWGTLAPLARYPVAHGQQGDFDPGFNINQASPNLRDARADIVCVLVSDSLPDNGATAATTVNGMGSGYMNLRARLWPNKTVGRGPNPPSNKVQESTYDWHEGILQEDLGQVYTGYFNGADLNVTGVSKVFESGLVAHYPFDGNEEDLGDYRNPGTLFGDSMYMSDANRSGLMLRLDGDSDYMDAADTAAISALSEISLGAWVKWNNATSPGTQTILSKASEFKLNANATHLEVQLWDDTGPTQFTGSNATVFTPGQWYHLFATYDGTDQNGVRLYINGFEVNPAFTSTPAFSGSLNDNGANPPLRVGSDGAALDFNGSMDDVRIYNVALEDWEVQDLYVDERVPPGFDPGNGLVAYYPFTDGSLQDSSARANHANATGAPTPVIDRHNSRNNNDAYQLTPGNVINTQTDNGFNPEPLGNTGNDFTLSLWLNNSTATGFSSNDENGTAIVANQQYRQFELRVSNNGTLTFYTGPVGVDNVPNHESPILNWDQSRWYHVVLARQGDRVAFYRDGVRQGSGKDIPGKVNAAPSSNPAIPDPGRKFLTFGESPGASAVNASVGNLTGQIDDVRLYERGFSAGDVAELYLFEKPRQQGLLFDPLTSLEAHWPISGPEYGDGALVRDMTANNHTATTLGTELTAGRGPGKPGMNDVNGSYDMFFSAPSAAVIVLGSDLPQIGNGNFTWSFWANATAFPTNDVILLGNRQSAGAADSWWIDLNSTGHVSFGAQGAGAPITPIVSTIPLKNDWTQVVVTRDATTAAGGTGTLNIYIDGVLAGTGLADIDINDPLWPVGDDIRAGHGTGSGDNWFEGSMDEIRYYSNRELLDWEVARLHDMESPNTVGSASIKINFGTDESISTDTVQLELFSNNHLIESPFHNQIYQNSGSSITHFFRAVRNGNAWQDMQGCWRITPQAGSVQVSSVEITVNGRVFVHRGTIIPSFSLAPNEFERSVHMNRDRFYGMVVRLNVGMVSYTFAHEMGHLFGASHALGDPSSFGSVPTNTSGVIRENDPELCFNPYGAYQLDFPILNYALGVPGGVQDEFLSAGNHFTAFGPDYGTVSTFRNYATVMAYTWITQLKSQTGQAGGYLRIPRFASPKVYWGGKATGDNHGRMLPPPFGQYVRPMYTDQVRAMTETSAIAGYYRDRTGSGRSPSRWSVPTRAPRGVPDMGGVPRRKSRANSRGAKASDSGDGSSGGSGGGASTRPGEPEISLPNSSDLGRATTTPSDGSSDTSTGPRTNPKMIKPSASGKSVPRTPPGKTDSDGTVVAGPSAKAAGSKPGSGVSVPNDSRRRSQLLALRLLAGRQYGATVSGHNLGATGGEDAAVPTGDGRPIFHGRSVWWHVEVPADGVYDLEADTHGSGIDTTLGVWLDGDPKPLATNDNDPRRSGATSAVRVRRITLQKGQKIVLALDGVNGLQGRLRLTVRLEPVR